MAKSNERQKQAEEDQDQKALAALRKAHPKTAEFKPLNGFNYDQGPRNEPGERRRSRER